MALVIYLRNYLLLFPVLALLAACERPEEQSALYGIQKGGEAELVFSDDLLELDIYYNNMTFKNGKVGTLYEQAIRSLRNNDTTAARETFLKAHALEPENPIILSGLGILANHRCDYEAAVGYYHKAIILSDSTFLAAFHNLGVAYLEQKDYENSLKAFKHILNNSNDSIIRAGACYVMAKAHLGVQECREAKDKFDEYYRLTKNNSNFAVMQEALFVRIHNCAGNVFGKKGSFIIDGEEFQLSLSSLTAENIGEGSNIDYILKLSQQDAGEVRTRWIKRSNFKNFLYTDFFEESHLTTTKIGGILNNKIFLTSRMSRRDTTRNAEIQYEIILENGEFEDLKINRVSYSLPEQSYRKEAAAE